MTHLDQQTHQLILTTPLACPGARRVGFVCLGGVLVTGVLWFVGVFPRMDLSLPGWVPRIDPVVLWISGIVLSILPLLDFQDVLTQTTFVRWIRGPGGIRLKVRVIPIEEIMDVEKGETERTMFLRITPKGGEQIEIIGLNGPEELEQVYDAWIQFLLLGNPQFQEDREIWRARMREVQICAETAPGKWAGWLDSYFDLILHILFVVSFLGCALWIPRVEALQAWTAFGLSGTLLLVFVITGCMHGCGSWLKRRAGLTPDPLPRITKVLMAGSLCLVFALDIWTYRKGRADRMRTPVVIEIHPEVIDAFRKARNNPPE